MQLLPDIQLRGFIKHYILIDSKLLFKRTFRLFSDGNMGIVFCLNGSIKRLISFTDYESLPNSFLYGQIDHYLDLLISENSTILIVVLQPLGISKLLGIDGKEFTNHIEVLDVIFGEKGNQVFEQIFKAKKISRMIDVLNNFFLNSLSRIKNSNQFLLDWSINQIIHNKGVIKIGDLVKTSGFTERHFERVFLSKIGISPKKFANTIKIHYYLKLISNTSSLTSNSYDAGYSDQPHAIKAFKKHTGLTPNQYLKNPLHLAVNFLML